MKQHLRYKIIILLYFHVVFYCISLETEVLQERSLSSPFPLIIDQISGMVNNAFSLTDSALINPLPTINH